MDHGGMPPQTQGERLRSPGSVVRERTTRRSSGRRQRFIGIPTEPDKYDRSKKHTI
jgi:hypothetical protein